MTIIHGMKTLPRLVGTASERGRDMIEKDPSASIAVYRLQAKLFGGRPDGRIQVLTSDCDAIQLLTVARDNDNGGPHCLKIRASIRRCRRSV
jgi:hypothetical protein